MHTVPILRTLSLAAGLVGAVALGTPDAHAKPTAPAAASSRGHGKGKKGHAKKRLDKLCAVVSCTAKQRKELEKIHADTRARTKPERERMKDLHKQMRAEWQKDKLDRAKIRRLHEEMQKQHAKIARARLDARMRGHDVLTPEQRKKAAELRKKHRGHHRGPHGGPPPGAPHHGI